MDRQWLKQHRRREETVHESLRENKKGRGRDKGTGGRVGCDRKQNPPPPETRGKVVRMDGEWEGSPVTRDATRSILRLY